MKRISRKFLLIVALTLTVLLIGGLVFGTLTDSHNEINDHVHDKEVILGPEAFEEIEVSLTCIGEIISDQYYQECIPRFSESDTMSEFIFWDFIFSIQQQEEYQEKYTIVLPAVNYEKESLIISCGREMKKLSYTEASRYGKYSYIDSPAADGHPPIGKVVFGKEYFPNTIFLYTYDNQKYPKILWKSVRNIFEIEE